MLASTQRQIWISTLAKASLAGLENLVARLEGMPRYDFLRSPEIGLTMVQGRAGGTGQPFYLGEMTLTRCVVRLQAEGEGEAIAGYSYIPGRSHRHAELAAVCDALLQHPAWYERVWAGVIQPLQQAAAERQGQQASQVEATRVNFFTLVRGES